MAKHKQRMETETNAEKRSQWAQKIDLWNKALTEVADLKGEYIAKDRKEVDFIEQIVTNIRRRLGVLLNSPQPLIIGMDDQIGYITRWLKDGSSHTADILTISGMGGIGKTTLAKYVYRLNCGEFQRSIFIEGISRTCAQQYNGLLDLQKQICGDILKPSSIQVRGHDVSVYTSKIENAIALKKMFVVLDDVDSLNQLDALLGSKGFHPGCKVIITTQDASLTQKYLLNLVVQPKHTKRLLEGLNDCESLKLLSLSAFKCKKPKEGYEEVSKRFVEYCKGHPLALEVLGKTLRNKEVAEWEDYIERLVKKGPHSHIKKVFQMSLDTLEEDEKELFKHIACFFVGKDRESIETILKACEIHTVSGIRSLVDRCLLSIGSDNKLMMHQLVQETGRDVVRQESPNRPEKRSRLWCHEESFKVLKQKKGRGNVLGLALDMRMLEKDKLLYELETDALSKMDNLKLLLLDVQLKGSFKNFPEELRWLCMHGFSLDYIPPGLQLENLVGLDISYSKLVSFDMSYGDPQRLQKRQKLTTGLGSKDKPLLRSLKILNLSYSERLRSLGGFSEFPALERLILSNCINLVEVCESIEQCVGLVLIDLSDCNEAGMLLRTIGKVNNVKILNLDRCNLGDFPIEMSDLELPEIVEANNIVINSQTFSSAIVEVIPRDLRSSGIFLPDSLVSLSLKDNHLSNESFPIDMSSLLMLELCLGGNDILSLPNCVRTLPRLEKLSIQMCRSLKTIEHPPRTLKRLEYHIWRKLGKVVFDQDMSPIKLSGMALDGFFIEGMFKYEDMGDVEEGVLRSLGWTNLDFTKLKPVQTGSEVQMLYEFGIFSTVYRGKEMPNWISDIREGSSISFTIPSSPYNLRGLNFCFVLTVSPRWHNLPYVDMKISNITRNRTWIYFCRFSFQQPVEGTIIYLSHWIFGKNEMEDGDQITISILENCFISIRECGVSLVYDDGRWKKKKKMRWVITSHGIILLVAISLLFKHLLRENI